MENNENNTQDSFQAQNGGYTQAPANQQTGGQQFQSSGYQGQSFGNGQGIQEPQNEEKGLAIGGMVLGIISLVCCCTGWIGIVVGIVGLVLSIISIVKKKGGKGMAIAGIICAAIGLVLSAFILLFSAGVNSLSPSEWDTFIEEIQDEIEQETQDL